MCAMLKSDPPHKSNTRKARASDSLRASAQNGGIGGFGRSTTPRLMDGAMGTMLLTRGYTLNDCLEELNLIHPGIISQIHEEYVRAGADVIVTNTFGANRPERFYRLGVQIAKEAAGSKAKVFASIGPGSTDFSRQVRALEKEKPDGYLVETMISLEECESAVRAIREISNHPVIALMTFPRGATAKTLEKMSQRLRLAGAERIGFNCGKGPEEVLILLEILTKVDRGSFCVRPAAGLPSHLLSPEAFAAWGPKFLELGCDWIGGCCGTTPDHIRVLSEHLKQHLKN